MRDVRDVRVNMLETKDAEVAQTIKVGGNCSDETAQSQHDNEAELDHTVKSRKVARRSHSRAEG